MSCEDEVMKIGKKLEKMISNNSAVSIHACSSYLPLIWVLKGGGGVFFFLLFASSDIWGRCLNVFFDMFLPWNESILKMYMNLHFLITNWLQ